MSDFENDNDWDMLLLKELENVTTTESQSMTSNQRAKHAPIQPLVNTRQKSLFEAFKISPKKRPLQAQPCQPRNSQHPQESLNAVEHVDAPLCNHVIDTEAFKTWIYPINYTLRDYQFNIVQKALFSNTLVALPTGLGKTFIAAVVMYNFFRWFPNGKVIFMAPTKPLVTQQIEACYQITGLPRELTEELTGSKAPESRRHSWKTKRVRRMTLIN